MAAILYSLPLKEEALLNGSTTGRSIAFVNNGKLCTMNADGSDKKEVSGISRF